MVSSLLKRTSLRLDGILRPRAGISVLIYHRVGADSVSPVDLDTDEFARQMEMIAATEAALTLDAALDRLDAGDSRPGIVVTFDDGTRDFTEFAVPIMVAHGIPALLYAETGPISSGQDNASGLRPTSWSALRDAVSTGLVEIGSHTHTHRLLHTIDEPTAVDELDRSISEISENIGRPPRHFAYPKAVLGHATAERLVRERFRSAALGHGGTNVPGCNVFRLARTPIQRTDTPQMVSSKLRGGMRFEGAVRSAASRWRYRTTDR